VHLLGFQRQLEELDRVSLHVLDHLVRHPMVDKQCTSSASVVILRRIVSNQAGQNMANV
jgi:hypothetical protein